MKYKGPRDSIWIHKLTGNILVYTFEVGWGWVWEDDEGFFVDCLEFYDTYEKIGYL